MTNAIDLKGNGEVNTIFGSNKGNEAKDFGEYLGRSFFNNIATGMTDLTQLGIKSYTGRSVEKPDFSNFNGVRKEFRKEFLWEAGEEFLLSKPAEEGFRNTYEEWREQTRHSLDSPYPPYSPPLYTPEIPNQFPNMRKGKSSISIFISEQTKVRDEYVCQMLLQCLSIKKVL